ncbi:MAG: DUF4249 domain-containing protein [Bacteroidetes bacterium]|nr:DUF4249 domain-containing protein [Bacteroidota bacterium]
MKIFPTTVIILFLALLVSCEKNIIIDTPKAEEKIVIEGWIDLNDFSEVMLTKNLPYFGSIDSTMIFNLIIQNATVIVSEGNTNDTLKKEINLDIFPPVFYHGTKIKGEVGKTYTLTVNALGKTLTAHTTIPSPVLIDTLWFKKEPLQDSLGYIWGFFTDPPEYGNNYRLFTKRLHKDKRFIAVFGSVFDDKFFNGQSFQFSLMRGAGSNNYMNEDKEFGYYKIGDTIVVKVCTIDKPHYDFWRSAEGSMHSGANPFSNPTQIVSNIDGGGLGIWGGYGIFYDTIVAK